jgi:hypothetical protein
MKSMERRCEIKKGHIVTLSSLFLSKSKNKIGNWLQLTTAVASLLLFSYFQCSQIIDVTSHMDSIVQYYSDDNLHTESHE